MGKKKNIKKCLKSDKKELSNNSNIQGWGLLISKWEMNRFFALILTHAGCFQLDNIFVSFKAITLDGKVCLANKSQIRLSGSADRFPFVAAAPLWHFVCAHIDLTSCRWQKWSLAGAFSPLKAWSLCVLVLSRELGGCVFVWVFALYVVRKPPTSLPLHPPSS